MLEAMPCSYCRGWARCTSRGVYCRQAAAATYGWCGVYRMQESALHFSLTLTDKQLGVGGV